MKVDLTYAQLNTLVFELTGLVEDERYDKEDIIEFEELIGTFVDAIKEIEHGDS